MLSYALVSFAIAALGGLVLASYVLRGKLAPWSLSLLHASLGALGLVLVLLSVLAGGGGTATIALAILAVAALGGFYLASFHLKGKVAPGGVVIVHAAVAVSGFLLLLGVFLNYV